jgi:hypothetical protein
MLIQLFQMLFFLFRLLSFHLYFTLMGFFLLLYFCQLLFFHSFVYLSLLVLLRHLSLHTQLAFFLDFDISFTLIHDIVSLFPRLINFFVSSVFFLFEERDSISEQFQIIFSLFPGCSSCYKFPVESFIIVFFIRHQINFFFFKFLLVIFLFSIFLLLDLIIVIILRFSVLLLNRFHC